MNARRWKLRWHGLLVPVAIGVSSGCGSSGAASNQTVDGGDGGDNGSDGGSSSDGDSGAPTGPCTVTFSGDTSGSFPCQGTLGTDVGVGPGVTLDLKACVTGASATQPAAFEVKVTLGQPFSAQTYAPGDVQGLVALGNGDAFILTWNCSVPLGASTSPCPSFQLALTSVDPLPLASNPHSFGSPATGEGCTDPLTAPVITQTHGTLDVAVPGMDTQSHTSVQNLVAHFVF